MADFRFRLNPRAGELPHCSAVLNGRGTRYEVSDYRTTLSLKSVVRGVARYHTPQGHYLLTPECFLLLNHGQRYSSAPWLEDRSSCKTPAWTPPAACWSTRTTTLPPSASQ